ncbi:right-handed parallel beta-helix repeat-containing protein [[Actinomadura] parvosata]|uniref:right-handed parallel beta-helix repeat-containing protein n=1 Tax=[Actinomadura] parvosata TaxID=1955412 RepID=UPI00406C36F3
MSRGRRPRLTAAALSIALALPAMPGAAHASALDVVSCGDVLTSSVTLTADLVCAGGDALTVGADGVTIDLDGHSITGDGTGTAVRVHGHTGLVLRDGRVSGFAEGLDARSGSDVTVEGIRFKDALVRGRNSVVTVGGTLGNCRLAGADLRGGPGKLVVDRCRVTGEVWLYESNHSAIRHSLLSHGLLGIGQSDRGEYVTNVFDDFPVLMGTPECRRNLFKGNVFKNAGTAFETSEAYTPANANVIEQNVFRANDIGLLADYTFRNTIVRGNVFTANRTVGMYLENRRTVIPSPDPVSGNVFVGNGHAPSGIVDDDGNPVQGGLHLITRLDPAARIALADNVGTGNAGRMIWAPPGMVIDGGGNQGPCEPAPNPDLTCW